MYLFDKNDTYAVKLYLGSLFYIVKSVLKLTRINLFSKDYNLCEFPSRNTYYKGACSRHTLIIFSSVFSSYIAMVTGHKETQTKRSLVHSCFQKDLTFLDLI